MVCHVCMNYFFYLNKKFTCQKIYKTKLRKLSLVPLTWDKIGIDAPERIADPRKDKK